MKLFEEFKAAAEPLRSRLRNRLVEQNAGLAKAMAPRFLRWCRLRVDPEDAEQVAFLALMRALETYDPSKSSFSRYASLWIRSFLQRAARGQDVVFAKIDEEITPDDVEPRDSRLDVAEMLQSLETLPPVEREAVERVHIAGLSKKQAALTMKLSAEAFDIAYHRGMATLQADLGMP